MPSNTQLCCAVVQMNSSDDWRSNFNNALMYIEEASASGARLVLFPENFLCFGQSALAQFAPHVDACIEQFQSLSNKTNMTLICGSIPVENGEGKYYARSLVIAPEKDTEYYDKIHLFDVDVDDGVGAYRESDTYCAGDDPKVVYIEGVGLGLSICYDLRFPELYQHYAKQGVQLITVPSAFTYATGSRHWELLLRARAIETQSFVLAANQCGEHQKSRRTWGNSMIIDPDGNILTSANHEPDIIVANLDLSFLSEIRKKMPIAQHKRL